MRVLVSSLLVVSLRIQPLIVTAIVPCYCPFLSQVQHRLSLLLWPIRLTCTADSARIVLVTHQVPRNAVRIWETEDLKNVK